MSKIEEIEARRAARRAATDEKRTEQEEKDLEAIEALEVKNDEPLKTMSAAGFVPGLPVRVGFKAPSAEYYKRFCQQVRRAGSNLEARGSAQDLLGASCWVYPEDKATRDSMLAAFPGILVSVALEATKLAELTAEDEGKG